jgi:hypothetical protein
MTNEGCLFLQRDRLDCSYLCDEKVFFTPVNDAIETQRAYGLVHLRAGFEPAST